MSMMTRVTRSTVVAWAVAWAGTATSGTADWPQWRGPNRDGISNETDWTATWPDGRLKVLWKVQVGEGFSGPAIEGKRLYALGFVKVPESKSLPANEGPGLDQVWCLDTDTGKPVWKHTYPSTKGRYYGPFTTPTVDGNAVFTLSKLGRLHCLDVGTGRVIWKRDIVEDLGAEVPYYGYASCPLVVGDLVIVVTGGKGSSMAALNKKTGEPVWKTGAGGQLGYCSPVVREAEGKTNVVLLTPAAVVAVDVQTGQETWRHPWKSAPNSAVTTPIVVGSHVFVSACETKKWCLLLEAQDGQPKVVWENRNMLNYFNASVLWNDNLYGIHSLDHVSKNWRLRCVDFSTGAMKWEHDEPGLAAVTLAGGRLIIASEKGQLIIAEATPQRYVELSRAKVLEGKCWLPPVLCRGRIYCRDHRGTLACLDMRAN